MDHSVISTGIYSTDPTDSQNLAYRKPARSNLHRKNAACVTDGSLKTYWTGDFYPAYVDIDLLEQTEIADVRIYIPAGNIVYYSLYGSNDGIDYRLLSRKRDQTAATDSGDSIVFAKPERCRILRVFLEWTKGDACAVLSEVKVHGTPLKTGFGPILSGTFEDVLKIEDFSETPLALPITESETIENVYGIIDRTVGSQYRNWFSFELAGASASRKDWFELSDRCGKIHIRGNEGLSLACGLNYYYKHFVHVQISEQTIQGHMPEIPVTIGNPIRKETSYPVRYAYNYCTLSYTFAFFGEKEWQRENDWLALNGINLVLDLAGQEAVWIRFLMELGYSFADARDWLCGPCYYAWQFMDNMESFGGPISIRYIEDRVNLARKTRRWKNSLGMQTILQGYAGMVPTDFSEVHPEVAVLKQGGWNGNSRPDMIPTDTALYDDYAAKFYKVQEYIYGSRDHYYAVDPFHEGGHRPAHLSDETISRELMESLLSFDSKAVWTVQAWQSNPTQGLLAGMGKYRNDHVLILDLVKYPIAEWTKYHKSSPYGGAEFAGTSWVWGLLGNFGGTPTMNGELDTMVRDILHAHSVCRHMAGIGILSEATYDNPVVYDLLLDLVWENSIDTESWLHDYTIRRYGCNSENAVRAWKIMKQTNYCHGVRHTNEIFAMKAREPQEIGRLDIPYGAQNLQEALALLAEDFDRLKASRGYLYDLREIMRQHVSNYCVLRHNDLLDSIDAGDLSRFRAVKSDFLQAMSLVDLLQELDSDQMIGEWLGKAYDRSSGCDDFTRDLFEINAKALITSWGGRNACLNLRDYAWRNYSSLFSDLYVQIWKDYLNAVEKTMETGRPTAYKPDYPDFYWNWVMNGKTYSRTPHTSPEEVRSVLYRVLTECTITENNDPDIGNLALNALIQTDVSRSNDVIALHDGRLQSSASGIRVISIDLIAQFSLSRISIIPKASPTLLTISGSKDGKVWQNGIADVVPHSDQHIEVPVQGIFRYLRITADTCMSISEVRVYGAEILADHNELNDLIHFAREIPLQSESLREALRAAADLSPVEGPDAVSRIYWNLYRAVVDARKQI